MMSLLKKERGKRKKEQYRDRSLVRPPILEPPHKFRDPIPQPPPALIGSNLAYDANGGNDDDGVDH